MFKYLLQRVAITSAIFYFTAQPTLAHDGSIHTTDAEMWVSGLGIVIIILVFIHTTWVQSKDNETDFDDNWLAASQDETKN